MRQAAREGSARSTLTVSVTPTFGPRWLAPRLGRFWRAHPDIDLRLHHSVHLVDFARDGVDLGVRWGRGQWPGVVAEPLLHAHSTPMCAPQLLTGERPLLSPSDLQHHVLLHEADYQECTEWLVASGHRGVNGQRGPIIDDPRALIRAAVDGN